MDSNELLRFLIWCEELQTPRVRLCQQLPLDEFEHNPIFQTVGWNDKDLGNDDPGQAGIRELVKQYNDWVERSKTPGKASPLTAVVVDHGDD